MFHLHQTHHLVHYFRNKELDELYASVFLKSLAISLVSIFVPIYLYQLGFTFAQICFFFIIHYLIALIMFFYGTHLCAYVGMKKIMVLGTFLEIVYFFSLADVASGGSYLLAGALFGLSSGAYYSGLHLDFVRTTSKKSEGKQISFLRIWSILAVTIGPFIGALFIFELAFITTLYVVAGLLFVSTIPLLFTKDVTAPKRVFSLHTAVRAGSWRNAFGHYGEAIGALAGGVFWPLFIFISVVNVLSLGIIFSLASFLTIIALYFVGKWTDKNRDAVLCFGVWTHAPIWITRLFFLNPIGLFVNNFLSSLTAHVLQLPFEKFIYDTAGKHAPANYLFYREVHLTIARVGLLLVGIISTAYNYEYIFGIAFLSTFFYLLPLRKKQKHPA